eukprot:8524276-Lingulodinium_polyedra.AAC.1
MRDTRSTLQCHVEVLRREPVLETRMQHVGPELGWGSGSRRTERSMGLLLTGCLKGEHGREHIEALGSGSTEDGVGKARFVEACLEPRAVQRAHEGLLAPGIVLEVRQELIRLGVGAAGDPEPGGVGHREEVAHL